MGILFTKYKCTINFETLSDKLAEIKTRNEGLEFISDVKVPLHLIEQFIRSQEKTKEFLLERYSEEIETYTTSGLQSLHSSTSTAFSKGFQLIINKSSQQLIGRLDTTIDSEAARLETLYVDENYSQRGLGTWLIGSALVLLKNDDNVKRIEANTDEKNEFALRALKKYDFFLRYPIDYFLKNLNK